MYYLHNIRKAILALLAGFSITSCANRVPPSGGPKDKTPPTLIGSIPKNGNTNVHTQEITLLFDEPIVQKNIRKELLITPRITSDYEYKIKKNTFILTLEEPLDSATTYTFNFRNSLVDITEGNPAIDLVLAFSTGTILDTLQIKGNVRDLFTHKPAAKLIVGLYDANDTLDLFNSPPYYLTKTDKKGNYLFRNIKAGSYLLYAFNDANNNNTCQSDREPYAFLEQAIQLDSNLVADTLNLQYLNIDTLKIKRAKPKGKYFIAVANKYLTDVSLTAANDSTLWYTLDKDHKEIKLYNTFLIKDSLMVQAELQDSLQQTAIDTFYLKFPETKRELDTYEAKLTKLEVYPESKKIQFKLTTNKPSFLTCLDSIRILNDTLNSIHFNSTWNIKKNKTLTEFLFSNNLPKAYLDSIAGKNKTAAKPGSKPNAPDATQLIEGGITRLKPGDKKTLPQTKKTSKKDYQLILPKGTLHSIEQDIAKQLATNMKPSYEKSFGTLLGKITTSYTHYTLQLITDDYKVVRELSPTTKFKITHIKPGDYRIRILIDKNKNGRWDAGNILKHQLPEPVLIYKDADGNTKTTVRANWEIELDISF